MEIIIKIQIDGDNVKVETERKEEKPVTEIEHSTSQYARWFDEKCTGWDKDPEFNMMFLKTQQRYINEKLKAKGHVFLNDVYDCLGIPRTSVGQVVGWKYYEDESMRVTVGDNFVDFGLDDEQNKDFIDGKTNKVLLDFNVDGSIISLI